VQAPAISGSVTSRWRGALAYAGLLLGLLRHPRRYRRINLQFSAAWPLEWLVFALLRRRFVFTVHNAVPHGFGGAQHRPTRWLARLARTLVFVSAATRDDFLGRYGVGFAAKSRLVPHGLLPVAPGGAPVPYDPAPGGGASPSALVFWSTVKPYKGVELFADLARSPVLRARGLGLEVHGRWDAGLHPLRDELAALGVTVVDRYLDTLQLLALLARDLVFVLPYERASQSGALYALLHHGCYFLCADTGDLGDFLRRHGLTDLLLRERSAPAVLEALDRLAQRRPQIAAALQRAQAALHWDRLLAQAGPLFGEPPAGGPMRQSRPT
jgi:glycosyltransferase involved in cell wall biosynthesis